jgi:hypothetical protein
MDRSRPQGRATAAGYQGAACRLAAEGIVSSWADGSRAALRTRPSLTESPSCHAREIGCFRFRSLNSAEVGRGRLRVKSDVSDFARLIAAEIGRGRLRVKADASPARIVATRRTQWY